MHRSIVSLLIAAALLGACASDPQVTPAPGRMTKTEYVESFTAGRFSDAYEQASAAATAAAPGRMRDEAALIAGLSAVRLDRESDARRWLEPLQSSVNQDISGRALAGLGLLAQQRGRHTEAVALLKDASDRLTGDEAARAAYHAGQSYDAMGRRDLARGRYAYAAATATDPALKGQAQTRLGDAAVGPAGGAFTLQVGAFASLSNAEECVRKYTPISVRLGLGLPRIDQRSEDKRTLFLVRVGRFSTRDEAAGHRRSFPGSAVADAGSNP